MKPVKPQPNGAGEGKQSSPVGVGVITIITVLLVLCLTIFSTLTMTSAKADLNLSKINADTVTAYYAADAEANAMAARFAVDEKRFELEETLPISETQSLYIHLIKNASDDVEILAWQTLPVGDEAGGMDLGGSALPVWDGELPG